MSRSKVVMSVVAALAIQTASYGLTFFDLTVGGSNSMTIDPGDLAVLNFDVSIKSDITPAQWGTRPGGTVQDGDPTWTNGITGWQHALVLNSFPLGAATNNFRWAQNPTVRAELTSVWGYNALPQYQTSLPSNNATLYSGANPRELTVLLSDELPRNDWIADNGDATGYSPSHAQFTPAGTIVEHFRIRNVDSGGNTVSLTPGVYVFSIGDSGNGMFFSTTLDLPADKLDADPSGTFTLTVTPEPGSLLLVAAGALPLLLRRRQTA